MLPLKALEKKIHLPILVLGFIEILGFFLVYGSIIPYLPPFSYEILSRSLCVLYLYITSYRDNKLLSLGLP